MKKVAVVAVVVLALLAGGSWANVGIAGAGQDAKGATPTTKIGGKGAVMGEPGAPVVRPHPRGLPREARRVRPRGRRPDRRNDRP